MNEVTMPAAEAGVDVGDEHASYELAFHILPTVAEGEVANVEAAIKNIVTNAGATLGLAEAAQRFDLAYELQKMIDGKYRRFTTSYFGWIRFTATPSVVADILAEVEAMPDVLRALLVRLTRQEEAHPFFLHEALAARKQVSEVDLTTPDADADEAEVSVEENDDAETAESDTDDTTTTHSDETATDEIEEDTHSTPSTAA